MTEEQVRKIVRQEIAKWAIEQEMQKMEWDNQEIQRHEQIMDEIYGPHGQG